MPDRDLDLLLDAARSAGNIAGQFFRGSFDVRDKGNSQGPVSEVDIKIDTMLRSELLNSRSGYGWLSEETEDNRNRLERDRVFIVDPIDGTRSFVDGKETFAHSLAVSENGRVVVAVVHLPILQLTYWATEDGGAFLNGQPLNNSGRSDLCAARVLAAAPQLRPDLWPNGVPPVERHFCSSLAYRLCLIAEGKYDAMVTLRDAWEWDIAAGELLCREAGAVVTDKFGENLRFNNQTPQCPGVLASSPEIHGGFLQHLGV